MERYVGSVREAFPGSRFNRSGGVLCSRVSPLDIDGEDRRRSALFNASLWLVSGMAFVKNYACASYLKKHRYPGESLPEILWKLGRSRRHVSSVFFDRFSRFNHQAKYGAAGWESLDLFYHYHEKVVPRLKRDLEGLVTRYWGGLENRQAATNRLKIVVRLLSRAFERYAGGEEIRVLSIASGSARTVMGAMKECPHLNIRALLLDNDASALAEAHRDLVKAGLRERCEIMKGTTRCLEEVCGRFRPHVVEMVGFLDYQPREKAVRLLSRIRTEMGEGGLLITCNINHNREKVFLDWTLLWPMIYRDRGEFLDLLLQAGFPPRSILMLYEPFGIHGLAVCGK